MLEGRRTRWDARPFAVLGLALVSIGVTVCLAAFAMSAALPKLSESSTALGRDTGTTLPSVLPENVELRIAELQGFVLLVQVFGAVLLVAGASITAILGRAAFA